MSMLKVSWNWYLAGDRDNNCCAYGAISKSIGAWSLLDFGFWILDCGLELKKVDALQVGRTLNPKSEI